MSTAGSIPAAPPGWYPDPAGTGRLRWWDGSAWTDQFSTPPQQGPYAGHYAASPYAAGPYVNVPAAVQRPFISRDAPVYNPLIWAITLLPLVPTLLLLFWNPELRFITVGRQQTPTLDPFSIFSPAYFMLLFSGFLAYAASVLLAYFDSERLKRIGVVRPFHWAWSFLSSGGIRHRPLGDHLEGRPRAGARAYLGTDRRLRPQHRGDKHQNVGADVLDDCHHSGLTRLLGVGLWGPFGRARLAGARASGHLAGSQFYE